jgi:hypothetical protein
VRTCQQNKANTHPTVPPLTPIKSSAFHPFQQLSCDLITNLPLSDSFDSLLVVVNHGLTKGVILCPTKKTITTKGVAVLFFHKVFLYFGLFDKVISNRGPQFTSSFTRELGKLLKYDLSLSTAYHPQTDGETERINQEVETYLRIFCGSNPTSWVEMIPHAEFAHNHHPHSITRKSPFYLMMGYESHALPSVIAIPLFLLSKSTSEPSPPHEMKPSQPMNSLAKSWPHKPDDPSLLSLREIRSGWKPATLNASSQILNSP